MRLPILTKYFFLNHSYQRRLTTLKDMICVFLLVVELVDSGKSGRDDHFPFVEIVPHENVVVKKRTAKISLMHNLQPFFN